MKQALSTSTAPSEYVQLAAFVVGDSTYALDIMRVREILRILPIESVREAPPYVEGVITLRGAYIPVVSMRKRLGLGEKTFASGRILVTMGQGRSFGLLIDSMTEVVRVPRASLQCAPVPQHAQRVPLLSGICEVRGRALQLLNINALIAQIPEDSALGLITPP